MWKIHKSISASHCYSLNDVTWPRHFCLSYPLLLLWLNSNKHSTASVCQVPFPCPATSVNSLTPLKETAACVAVTWLNHWRCMTWQWTKRRPLWGLWEYYGSPSCDRLIKSLATLCTTCVLLTQSTAGTAQDFCDKLCIFFNL